MKTSLLPNQSKKKKIFPQGSGAPTASPLETAFPDHFSQTLRDEPFAEGSPRATTVSPIPQEGNNISVPGKQRGELPLDFHQKAKA